VSKALKRITQAKILHEQLSEASYAGNIGIMELIKFYNKATPDLISKVKGLIAKKKNKEAWEIIQQTTGVKLHKSIHEDVKSNILPKAGAGQWGTDELMNTYKNDTPGQSPVKKVKSLKDYKK
jgi:hypothetical protein